MTKLDAKNMPAKELCARIRESTDTALAVEHVNGQRYIAAGLGKKELTLTGTPGNALGAYLNGTRITVLGNAQDATGDTMNDGAIFVHGSSGDATGYAMRGGKIYVRGNAGYRAGIHMKAYREKQPVLIIGGEAGSFLGEYQAGGIIIVLGLGSGGRAPVGRFVGTGMHGGRMLLRCDTLPPDLPAQVAARRAGKDDLAAVEPYLAEYCGVFGLAQEDILREKFLPAGAQHAEPIPAVVLLFVTTRGAHRAGLCPACCGSGNSRRAKKARRRTARPNRRENNGFDDASRAPVCGGKRRKVHPTGVLRCDGHAEKYRHHAQRASARVRNGGFFRRIVHFGLRTRR